MGARGRITGPHATAAPQASVWSPSKSLLGATCAAVHSKTTAALCPPPVLPLRMFLIRLFVCGCERGPWWYWRGSLRVGVCGWGFSEATRATCFTVSGPRRDCVTGRTLERSRTRAHNVTTVPVGPMTSRNSKWPLGSARGGRVGERVRFFFWNCVLLSYPSRCDTRRVCDPTR